VTWGTPVQSFVFLGLLVFELEPMYATSDRQTDDDHRLMPPRRGHNKWQWQSRFVWSLYLEAVHDQHSPCTPGTGRRDDLFPVDTESSEMLRRQYIQLAAVT